MSNKERHIPTVTFYLGAALYIAWSGLIKGNEWAWYFGTGILVGMTAMWLNQTDRHSPIKVMKSGS